MSTAQQIAQDGRGDTATMPISSGVRLEVNIK